MSESGGGEGEEVGVRERGGKGVRTVEGQR